MIASLTVSLIDWLVAYLFGWLILLPWLIDWLTDWFIDSLIHWFIDSLIHWLIGSRVGTWANLDEKWLLTGALRIEIWWKMPPGRGLGGPNGQSCTQWVVREGRVRTSWGQGDANNGNMSAPYGPKTIPRELIWRTLGRFGDDFGVKMGLELEIVGLAKPLKKQRFFRWFSLFRGCLERVFGLQIATKTRELEDWRIQWLGVRSWKLFYDAKMRDSSGFMGPRVLEHRLKSGTSRFNLRTKGRAGASYARFL